MIVIKSSERLPARGCLKEGCKNGIFRECQNGEIVGAEDTEVMNTPGESTCSIVAAQRTSMVSEIEHLVPTTSIEVVPSPQSFSLGTRRTIRHSKTRVDTPSRSNTMTGRKRPFHERKSHRKSIDEVNENLAQILAMPDGLITWALYPEYSLLKNATPAPA
ncbi:hypothetical protein EJ08DRAFT_720166, partial [Tothia fuscella]